MLKSYFFWLVALFAAAAVAIPILGLSRLGLFDAALIMAASGGLSSYFTPKPTAEPSEKK